MLVNLLQILRAVKNKKASRHFVTRPTQVILPLFPNHGLFGNDGLYSESKISFSNDGPLKVGVNTSVWLVQSLGKFST
jgi:3-oxoacyl-ACP reductase-like protein